jgi:hypothetical protein
MVIVIVMVMPGVPALPAVPLLLGAAAPALLLTAAPDPAVTAVPLIPATGIMGLTPAPAAALTLCVIEGPAEVFPQPTAANAHKASCSDAARFTA